jgi:hypothetical protein
MSILSLFAILFAAIIAVHYPNIVCVLFLSRHKGNAFFILRFFLGIPQGSPLLDTDTLTL